MHNAPHHQKRTSLIWMIVLVAGLSVILAGCGGSAATPVAQAPTVTATDLPPTDTPIPPTSTPLPPTATATPQPTDTPVPATDEPSPAATEATTAAIDGSDAPSFAADIQPIIVERCIKCHLGDNAPRGLNMETYDNLIAGGTYRTVIEPGSPAESQLVKRITGESTPRMPFDGPPYLDDEQIALIIAWIEAGAPNN